MPPARRVPPAQRVPAGTERDQRIERRGRSYRPHGPHRPHRPGRRHGDGLPLAASSNPSNYTLAYATFSSSYPEQYGWAAHGSKPPSRCQGRVPSTRFMYRGLRPTRSFLGGNTLTYTLYKNNATTGLTVNLAAPTTLNQNAQANATGSVTVVAGDELAIGVTQTNGAGSQVLSLVSVRCQ